MLFPYDNEDRTMYLNWCHRVVTSILSQKSRYVLIKWDIECLDQGGPEITKEKLSQDGTPKRHQKAHGGNVLDINGNF